jgi:hypothetical protein
VNIRSYLSVPQLIIYAVIMIFGIVVGYKLAPDQPKVVSESHAPAIQLPSGALVAERVPDAPVPQPIVQAAKEVGGRVVQAGSVTVKPTQIDCPEVKIDWGLTEQKDKTKRMTFYTEDGTILTATDIPVKSTTIKVHPKWSAGVIAPIGEWSGAGPVVERHFGKLSVGVAAVKIHDEWQGLATVKVSW